MALDKYVVTVKPNKWLEPNYARPYYDILDRTTGVKRRVSASELWNNPDVLTATFGGDAMELAEELMRRERQIESLKERYLRLYNNSLKRYQAGQPIPKHWMAGLEDLFDQMYMKDAEIGNFGGRQRDDVPRTIAPVEKPIVRSPDIEAPHYSAMPNVAVAAGEEYQRSTMELARKCEFLTTLEKENEAVTAGPTGARVAGYVNPNIDEKVFGNPPPISTKTEGCRNPLYSKKKKKQKYFMKAQGFVDDIEELTNDNEDFRRVLYTGKHSQLVLMKLSPGEEIGEEVHENIDQFFRVDSGEGVVIIDGNRHRISDGAGIIVPAGSKHNVINSSRDTDLKLYTIYSPPEHKEGTIRHTKEEAEKMKEEFDGQLTEMTKAGLKYPLDMEDPQTSKLLDKHTGAQKMIAITPEEFLSKAPLGYQLPDSEYFSSRSLHRLIDRMKSGKPIDPLWIKFDVDTGKMVAHEGRHRAIAAKKLGISKLPMIVVFVKKTEDGYKDVKPLDDFSWRMVKVHRFGGPKGLQQLNTDRAAKKK